MAESTLSLTYMVIADEICDLLGWPAYSSCVSAEKARVQSYMKSGLRQFYIAHPWRFLTPEVNDIYTTDTRASGGTAAANVPMEDGFGGMAGPVSFYLDYRWLPLETVTASRMRDLRQYSGQSASKPQALAIVQVDEAQMAADKGTRWYMYLWPTPDQAYQMMFSYHLLPPAWDGSADDTYPFGGMTVSEAILQSCLAITEQRANDTLGIHTELYQKALIEAIKAEGVNQSPQILGYNGDGVMDAFPRGCRSLASYTATINYSDPATILTP